MWVWVCLCCAYRQYLFQATAHKFISDVQPEVQLIRRCYQCIDKLHACNLQQEVNTGQREREREREMEREKEREREKSDGEPEKGMTDFFQKLMKSMPACILNELCPLEAEDHN